MTSKQTASPPRRKRVGLGPWFVAAAVVIGLSTVLSSGLLPSVDRLLFGSTAEAHDLEKSEPAAKPAAKPSAESTAAEEMPEPEQGPVVDTDSLMAKVNLAQAQQAVAILSAMPPYRVAPMLAAMAPADAVAVIRQMDQDLAAAALAAMDPTKSAELGKLLLQPAAAQR